MTETVNGTGPAIRIMEAARIEEIHDVRDLVRAFVAWHRRRHVSDAALIERYFDPSEMERELDGLPGYFSPPNGRLLIAYFGDRPAGCVALRDLGEGACEMKRMFVRDEFRGMGVGRALAGEIILAAREIGYRRMLLDTSHRQLEAVRLYERSGFRRIDPYYPLPDDLRDWLVFMELDLCGPWVMNSSMT